jgi:serine/threonine-protein kinase
MEYVDGSDLRALLKATPHGRLKLPIALHIISEVLRGLEAVHGATDGEGVPRRIVHRDVSPANVLLDRAGLVKLGDFGIAHATSRLTQTRNGAVKGKLRYMAPEQLKAQPVDHRVDLYAVGVMLLEALFGSEACEPRRMSSHGPVFVWERARAPRNLPGDVADILDRALAIDPARRYPNAGAFRRDDAAALHHRAPGYSSTELAADIDAIAAEAHAAASDNTELATSPGESPFDVSDSSALFFEEQKPTVPFRPVPAELVLPSTAPFPQVEAERYVAPPDSGQIALLRGRPWKKVALAGAVTAAAVLSIVLAIALGSASSAAAPPLAAAPVAPRAPVVPVSRPATGTLDVEGPRGSLVMIGTTAYPPAPCRLELPAGHYQVKVRRGKRMRFVTRSVEILPGAAVTLRI